MNVFPCSLILFDSDFGLCQPVRGLAMRVLIDPLIFHRPKPRDSPLLRFDL